MVRQQAYDVSELAIVTALQAIAFGHPVVILPVVVAARFQRRCLITLSSRALADPRELRGQRVGVRAYTQTTGFWIRSHLAEDYDLAAGDMEWVTQDEAHVPEYADPPFVHRTLSGGLVDALRAGEIDAAILGNDLPSGDEFAPVIGAFLPKVGMNVQQVSDIFIDLITMVTGLIVFCTVTLGIAKVRDFGKVGRIAVKALIYFEVITTLALVIGLVVVNVLRPGAGLHINPATFSGAASVKAAKSESLGDFIESLVPTSAVGAFAEGNILQVVVFSVLFGCGVATVGDKAEPLINVIEVTQRAVFWIIRQVMRLAPLAACAAIAFSVSTYGLHTLVSLGALLLEFLLTVVLFFVLASTRTIPVASVALILGVSKVMSAMFLFANIVGNCVATIVVGKWENAIDWARMRAQPDAGHQPVPMPAPATVDSMP
jgi:L-cystine uptake protein TcyP (sodium:dicarboxylate symporter family)